MVQEMTVTFLMPAFHGLKTIKIFRVLCAPWKTIKQFRTMQV